MSAGGRNSSAWKHQPKRPLNYYLKFRADKLQEYKDDPLKLRKIKSDWRNMDEKEKDKLKAKQDAVMEEYHKEVEEWKKKYNIKDEEEEEVRTKPSKEKKNDKEKGSRVNESPGKKKEAKEDKGKSKDGKKKEASRGRPKKS